MGSVRASLAMHRGGCSLGPMQKTHALDTRRGQISPNLKLGGGSRVRACVGFARGVVARLVVFSAITLGAELDKIFLT